MSGENILILVMLDNIYVTVNHIFTLQRKAQNGNNNTEVCG